MKKTETEEKSPFLTAFEVMDILKITRPTVNAWAKKGVIRRLKIPGIQKAFFSRESVEMLLKH